jgi:hypothetical protein
MTAPTMAPEALPRRPGRSALALLAGFLVGAILSLGTDQLLHIAHVYPPWGEPMNQPGLNLLALSYRIAYSILGSYIVAKLAPRAPMFHSILSGVIGLVLSSAGIVAATKVDLGPLWYPVALALSCVPCAWVGGKLYLSAARAN